jgi:hypothetical protein
VASRRRDNDDVLPRQRGASVLERLGRTPLVRLSALVGSYMDSRPGQPWAEHHRERVRQAAAVRAADRRFPGGEASLRRSVRPTGERTISARPGRFDPRAARRCRWAGSNVENQRPPSPAKPSICMAGSATHGSTRPTCICVAPRRTSRRSDRVKGSKDTSERRAFGGAAGDQAFPSAATRFCHVEASPPGDTGATNTAPPRVRSTSDKKALPWPRSSGGASRADGPGSAW